MLCLDEYEVIEASKHVCKSREGCGRKASIRLQAVGTGDWVDFCAWHAMYGESKWASDNEGEIALVGSLSLMSAKKSMGRKVHVPALDGHGRLSADDAEKFMLGVLFTTRMLRRGIGASP